MGGRHTYTLMLSYPISVRFCEKPTASCGYVVEGAEGTHSAAAGRGGHGREAIEVSPPPLRSFGVRALILCAVSLQSREVIM